MSQHNKKELNLDLDDVTGGKKTSPIQKERKKVKSPTKSKHGYMLTFPTKNPKKFISKDILDCTGEEFLLWAKVMHPFISRPSKDFDSKENRIRAFNHIIGFHKSGLAWLRSNENSKNNQFN